MNSGIRSGIFSPCVNYCWKNSFAQASQLEKPLTLSVVVGASIMFLRDHPLMRYKGNRSWPPSWLWRAGDDITHPTGEVGILKDVAPSTIYPYDRCFLIMEHGGAEYIGALLLSDTAFCREIFRVLVRNRGKTIQEIGGIDLRYTF